MQIDGKSPDLALEKINTLKALFPEVVSEQKIDFERLRQVLSAELASKEHYELSWAGKSQARQEIQKQTTTTLTPKLSNFEDGVSTSGFFIEGENLEVLRVLQRSYFGKVKMIYIDPPYNTGNDSFVYPDDYAERKIDYEKRTDIKDAQGYLNKQDLLRKNTKDNGQFHSVWLSMMYPRLYLSRNLLREDGVIFISIDDNEAANLKLLCDEVFGEENFISQMAWRRTDNQANIGTFAKVKEYVLLYCKNTQFVQLYKMSLTERALKEYRYEDKRGKFRRAILLDKTRGRHEYEITTPTNKKMWGTWMIREEEMLRKIENNEIYWTKGGDEQPYGKIYLSESEGQIPNDFLGIEFGTNQEGSLEVETLFEKRYFDFPKPCSLVKHLLVIGTQPNENHLILDFFAGSGTTAQAVMELNEEDGGNRQFICVQLPELLEASSEAYKAGYITIADITQARITKVIEKIAKNRAGKLDFANKPLPTCLAYRLTDSHFKIWQSHAEDAESILKQLDTFQESQKPEATPENMLTELLLKLGFGLGASVRKIPFGAEGFLYQVQDVCFCFDAYNEALKEQVLALKPAKLLMLDACFADDNTLKNFQLELKGYEISLTII